MSRIFITGSSDGLGLLTAQRLVKSGHRVILHARNPTRAEDAKKACPGAESVLIADLSSLSATKKLAEEVNALGPFDTVIHNAGLYTGGLRRTQDGIPALVAVNTMAPYALTCLIRPKPKRLVYVSSGLHSNGDTSLDDILWKQRDTKFNDFQAYADSKLHDILLAKAVAKRWEDVKSNSLDPGWVATKMGGKNAPGDLNAAVQTYEFLSTKVDTSGKHFTPGAKEGRPLQEVHDAAIQDKLLKICEEVTGIKFPETSQANI